MQPRPPAEETAAARGAVEVWAMPARRMGWRMWRRVVRGVVRGGGGDGVGEAMVRLDSSRRVGREESGGWSLVERGAVLRAACWENFEGALRSFGLRGVRSGQREGMGRGSEKEL